VFPTQEPHVSGVWDAGAELVWLPQAEQVQPPASQVHPTHPTAGAHCPAQTQGTTCQWSTNISRCL
jgi:hypothetical protein